MEADLLDPEVRLFVWHTPVDQRNHLEHEYCCWTAEERHLDIREQILQSVHRFHSNSPDVVNFQLQNIADAKIIITPQKYIITCTVIRCKVFKLSAHYHKKNNFPNCKKIRCIQMNGLTQLDITASRLDTYSEIAISELQLVISATELVISVILISASNCWYQQSY